MVTGLEVEDFRVVHVPGSDHSAVVVDVAPGGHGPAPEDGAVAR